MGVMTSAKETERGVCCRSGTWIPKGEPQASVLVSCNCWFSVSSGWTLFMHSAEFGMGVGHRVPLFYFVERLSNGSDILHSCVLRFDFHSL